jgi:hypothetical protein
MKILLGDFNAKLEREEIFKPIIRNMSLHEISDDNGVRIVNFVTLQNLISVTFTHHNIKNAQGMKQSHTDHISMDKRWLSNIINVQSFIGNDCDTNHCLVVAPVTE